MSSSTAYNTLDKAAGEIVTFGMSFASKIAPGDSLLTTGTVNATYYVNGVDTGTAVPSGELSFSAPAIVPSIANSNPPGPGIAVRITGGISGSQYMIHFVGVQTNLGDTIASEGILSILA